MADGFVSICNLQQGATFSSAGLTVSSGATFKFNLGNATADRLAVTKAANVSGVVNVTIDTTGASSLTAGSYNLITASAGLTTGDPAWRFTGGGTSRLVTVGGAPYTLILIPSDTAITLACSLVSGTVYSVR
jgi:outer membrane autotransporter protein